MTPRVLVTYATRSGSTGDVAQGVVRVLRGQGLDIDIQPAKEVRTIDACDAVVLGVPLYMGRFHKDARRFLATHRTALSRIPVALFVLGPVQKTKKDWAGAREQLDKELARYPWLSPISREIVGGRFDPARLGFPYTLFPPLKKIPANDCLDWPAIEMLSSRLAEDFLAIQHV